MDDIYGAFKKLDGMVRQKYEEMSSNGMGPSTGMPPMPKLPDMASLMPKIVADMETFLRQNLPNLKNQQLSAAQVEGVIKEINGFMNKSQKLPSPADLKDLANQLQMTQDEIEFTMKEVRGYMGKVIAKIIGEMGLNDTEMKMAVASLGMTLGAMSHEEYMFAMQDFMGGDMGMGGGMMDFRIPDMTGVNQYVYDNVTGFMEQNLPKIGASEADVKAIVSKVQEEMKQESGPDFGKLPILFNEFNIDRKTQDYILKELASFLIDTFNHKIIPSFKGLPEQIRKLMIKAMHGTITQQFDTLSGHTDDFIPNFQELIPQFGEQIGQLLPNLMKHPELKSFMN